jgi:hypothetical protein
MIAGELRTIHRHNESIAEQLALETSDGMAHTRQ